MYSYWCLLLYHFKMVTRRYSSFCQTSFIALNNFDFFRTFNSVNHLVNRFHRWVFKLSMLQVKSELLRSDGDELYEETCLQTTIVIIKAFWEWLIFDFQIVKLNFSLFKSLQNNFRISFLEIKSNFNGLKIYLLLIAHLLFSGYWFGEK